MKRIILAMFVFSVAHGQTALDNGQLSPVNQTAFDARSQANQAACDVVAREVRIGNPGQVIEAMVAAKQACLQEREIKQHNQSREQCRKTTNFKSCMNSFGYDVVQ